MKMRYVAKYLYVTLHKIKFPFSCFAVYSYVCAALMQEYCIIYMNTLYIHGK